MSRIKNAYHDEICDRADTEELREQGYSEAEIAALASPPIGEGPYDPRNAVGAPEREPQ